MKERIQTDQAPAAMGPYSQGIVVKGGTMLFCSGQVAMDPLTGAIVGADAAEQTKQVMKNLQAVLAAGGATFNQVVKTTIYLTDLSDFSAVNDVYASYFSADPPARATVQVARLPKDVKVEIDAIAVV
jgi:2-iminobutanoate/2-iminopropanoate deaminase